MLQEFTDQDIKEIIAAGSPVVVDCWATWCTACVKMIPTVERIAADYEGKVTVGKYNVEEETDIPADYAVRALPTLLFFNDGKLVSRLAGSQTYNAIDAKIKELLG